MATAGFMVTDDFYLQLITVQGVMKTAREYKLPAHFIQALKQMSGMEVQSKAQIRPMEVAILQMVRNPGGNRPNSLSFPRATAGKIYDAIAKEVHDIICSTQKRQKYKDVLKKLSTSVSALAGYLAHEIGQKLGIGGALLLAVILALLMLFAKIGRYAFCAAFNKTASKP